VTGLTVVDTGTDFSRAGQIIILTLVQCGGLGFMALSTLLVITAGKRLNFARHHAMQEAFTIAGAQPVPSLIRDIVLFTLGAEVLGAMALFGCLAPVHGVSHGAYLAVFHSVSAFCNAGFSLFHDSFSRYVSDPLVTLVICLLIIIGGLGFPVLSELRYRLGKRSLRWKTLNLHSKLVLSSTAVLLTVSTLIIGLLEWHNTLADFSVQGKWLAAFFQAVNTRTSGFNSLPLGSMANSTLFVMIILMFIGASPGSCGGGIKTTTATILTVLGLSRLRGQAFPSIFHRTISDISIEKAFSVVLISIILVWTGTLLLLLTEIGSVPHPESRGKFLELLFEVVSAFGTVGLSTGMTGSLTDAGKLAVTAIMFIGRLGPMVVVIAMSRSPRARYRYAREETMIG
jgi:trk system potassium uptake protein TrkH